MLCNILEAQQAKSRGPVHTYTPCSSACLARSPSHLCLSHCVSCHTTWPCPPARCLARPPAASLAAIGAFGLQERV